MPVDRLHDGVKLTIQKYRSRFLHASRFTFSLASTAACACAKTFPKIDWKVQFDLQYSFRYRTLCTPRSDCLHIVRMKFFVFHCSRAEELSDRIILLNNLAAAVLRRLLKQSLIKAARLSSKRLDSGLFLNINPSFRIPFSVELFHNSAFS